MSYPKDSKHSIDKINENHQHSIKIVRPIQAALRVVTDQRRTLNFEVIELKVVDQKRQERSG